MLIYNPAFDIYHTIFRQLQILFNSNNKAIEIERMYILGFYLTFPAELLKIRLPITASKYKKYLKLEINSYERIPNQKRLFMKMLPIQQGALKSLVGFGLIDQDLYKLGKIKLLKENLPDNLVESINTTNLKHSQIIELLSGPLLDIHLYGNGGLKERAGLIEFKYDPI